MRAGQLRHRITIEQASDARDEYGEPVQSWTTYAQAWAAVEPISGREYWSANQDVAKANYRIRLRHDPALAITTAMRVLFDGRTFDIEAVLNIGERGRELQMMCVEVRP
jgi:SPP1 family predicted phage head-tail adaptor